MQVPSWVMLHWDHHLGSTLTLGWFMVLSDSEQGLTPMSPLCAHPWPSCSQLSSKEQPAAGCWVGCGVQTGVCERSPGSILSGSF